MNATEATRIVTTRLDELELITKKELYCIRYQGEIIKLPSGKSSWNRKNQQPLWATENLKKGKNII